MITYFAGSLSYFVFFGEPGLTDDAAAPKLPVFTASAFFAVGDPPSSIQIEKMIVLNIYFIQITFFAVSQYYLRVSLILV